MLPVAMPNVVATDPAVVRLARNAPKKMPGQTRYPSTRNAARAMPVGGQTAVALGCTKAIDSPSLAATKYRPAKNAITARRPLNPECVIPSSPLWT